MTSDIIFIVDMLVRMNTASGEVCASLGVVPADARRGTIVKYHLRHSVPFETVSCSLMYAASFAPHVPIAGWWALSTFRMLRALRLLRYFASMERRLEVNIRKLQVYKFIVMIFMASHWVGCAFYFTSRVEDFGAQTWVFRFQEVMPSFDLTDATLGERYLVVLYKGFNGLTNLGYEGVPPGTLVEVILSVLTILAQVLLAGVSTTRAPGSYVNQPPPPPPPPP